MKKTILTLCAAALTIVQLAAQPVTPARQVDEEFRGYVLENLLIPVQNYDTAVIRIDDKQVVIDGYWEFKDEVGQVLENPIILSQPPDLKDQFVVALRSPGQALVEITEDGSTKRYRVTVTSRFRENEIEKELEEAIMSFVGDPELRVKVLPPQASLVGANLNRSFGSDTASDIVAPRGQTAGQATGQVLNANDFRPTIVLEGQVENDLVSAKALNIAHAYTENVVNLMSIRNPLQVRIGVKVIRVQHEKNRNIGIRHRSGPGDTFNLEFASAAPFFETGNGIEGTLPIFGSFAGVPTNYRTTVTLDELGIKATLLQEPALTVLNGQAAEFVVGQTVFISGGSRVVDGIIVQDPPVPYNVGVSLLVTPLVREEETYRPRVDGTIPWSNITSQESRWSREPESGIRSQMVNSISESGIIQMGVQPSISSLVPGGENGFPSFNTNTVETRVAMKHGESLVIGGLFDDQTAESMQSIPFLSQIPIIGELFKDRTNDKIRSELVFVLTPTVLGLKDLNNARDYDPRMTETREIMTDEKLLSAVRPVRISAEEIFVRAPDLTEDPNARQPPFPELAPRDGGQVIPAAEVEVQETAPAEAQPDTTTQPPVEGGESAPVIETSAEIPAA